MARKLGRADDRERRLSDDREASAPTTATEGGALLDRRSYIKLGGIVAAALPTTVGVARATTVERDGIEFRRVLDAVSDLGMDPSGEEPIDDELAAAGDGALVRFPDGAYRFGTDSPGVSLDGETRGFEGAGDDVTLLAPRGRRGFLLDGVGMEGAYLADVAVDRTAPDSRAGIRLRGDRVVVRDVVVRGRGDRHDTDTPVISVSTAGPTGTVASGPGPGSRSGPGRRELLVERLDRVPRHADRGTSGTDTLTIEGTGVATNYEITVDGRLEPETRPFGDGLSGSNSEGTVESDAVSFAVEGTITDFRLTGAANVFVNDRLVDPRTLGSTSPDRLVFDATGGTTSYAFSVGRLYPDDAGPPAPAVGEGVDVYRFGGGVESLRAKGTATLSVGRGGGC